MHHLSRSYQEKRALVADNKSPDQSANLCSIATGKAVFFIRKMQISFSFLHKNICCGYSLEAPQQGASNEYPQHMFSWRNRKNIMWIPPLICSYVCSLIMAFQYFLLIRTQQAHNTETLCCINIDAISLMRHFINVMCPLGMW